MLEDNLRQLTLTNEDIMNKMDVIIKAFVMFYGENKRSEVESKLSNTIILRIYNNEVLKDMINEVYTSALNEKMFKYLKVDSNSLLAIDYEELYIQLQNRDENGSQISWFVDSNTTPKDVIERYHNGEFKELEDIINTYLDVKRLISKYEEEYLVNKKYEEIIDKKYKRLLQKKYEEIIPEDIRSVLGSEYSDDFLCLLNIEETYNKYKTKLPILHFPMEGIKIEILKKFGFNHKTYGEVLNDRKARKFITRYTEYFNELNKAKKILLNIKVIETISSTKNYQDNVKAFEGMELLNDWLDDFNYYNTTQSWFVPNYYMDGDLTKFFACIVINLCNSSDCIDLDIIHELNHAFEYYFGYVNNRYISGGGWDFNSKETIEDGEFRKYELISEYVNERIAIDITNIMHSNGDFIYSLETPYKEHSLYMRLDFLLSDFYDTFKDIIIESRSNNNIDYLYNMIGKDNFDSLNDLVNEYNRRLSLSFNISRCLDNPKLYDLDTTKFINDLINKKNIIIENMKERLNKRNL